MALEGGHWRGGVGVGVVLLERHLDVVLQVEGGLRIIALGLEVHNEIILDGEDGVDGKVGIITGVDLVDDCGIFGVGDHEMDVGGTHGRTVHEAEENTGGAVGGEGVRSGVVAVPVKLSILVRGELATQVVIGLSRVLEIVLAVGGGLPDIEDSTGDWLASFHVPNGTVHEGNATIGFGILNDAVTESAEGCIGRPEGAEDNVGGGGDAILSDNLVGDLINKTKLMSVFSLFYLFRFSSFSKTQKRR